MPVKVGSLVNMKGEKYQVSVIRRVQETRIAELDREAYTREVIRPQVRIMASSPELDDFHEGDVVNVENEMVELRCLTGGGPACGYREIVSKWRVTLERKLEEEQSCTEKTSSTQSESPTSPASSPSASV